MLRSSLPSTPSASLAALARLQLLLLQQPPAAKRGTKQLWSSCSSVGRRRRSLPPRRLALACIPPYA